jgi:hypothetical protein
MSFVVHHISISRRDTFVIDPCRGRPWPPACSLRVRLLQILRIDRMLPQSAQTTVVSDVTHITQCDTRLALQWTGRRCTTSWSVQEPVNIRVKPASNYSAFVFSSWVNVAIVPIS